MDDNNLAQIYRDLYLKETEELLEIWRNGNYDEWEEDAFKVIASILQKRLGYVPPISKQIQVSQILKNVDRYFQTGDLDKALNECELAIQMMPDHAISYVYRGQIYDGMRDLEKAINDFQTALQLDPKSKDARENLAIVEHDIKEEFMHSTAKQHLDLAIDYANQNEVGKALEECELARPTMPGIAFAYNYMGKILEKLGQIESAIDAYLKALELNPRFELAQENLKFARFKQKDEFFRQAKLENGWEELEESEMVPIFDESQLSEIPDDNYPAPAWLYLDEKACFLTGWPGHRNLPGRIGFDPLENDFELAHMQGVMIRLLLIRKFRTHNPFYLLLLVFVGAIFCMPLIFGLPLLFQGFWGILFFMIMESPYWIVGIMLLLNVFLSFLPEQPGERDEYGYAFF